MFFWLKSFVLLWSQSSELQPAPPGIVLTPSTLHNISFYLATHHAILQAGRLSSLCYTVFVSDIYFGDLIKVIELVKTGFLKLNFAKWFLDINCNNVCFFSERILVFRRGIMFHLLGWCWWHFEDCNLPNITKIQYKTLNASLYSSLCKFVF